MTDRKIGHCEELDLRILRITLRWLIQAESRFGKGHEMIESHAKYALSIVVEWVYRVAGDDHRHYKKAMDCIEGRDYIGALNWIGKIEEV